MLGTKLYLSLYLRRHDSLSCQIDASTGPAATSRRCCQTRFQHLRSTTLTRPYMWPCGPLLAIVPLCYSADTSPNSFPWTRCRRHDAYVGDSTLNRVDPRCVCVCGLREQRTWREFILITSWRFSSQFKSMIRMRKGQGETCRKWITQHCAIGKGSKTQFKVERNVYEYYVDLAPVST